jgi:hypothetical protein
MRTKMFSLTLMTMYGHRECGPSEAQLKAALDEVYSEKETRSARRKSTNVPGAWLEFSGRHGGTWGDYVIEILTNGTATFTGFDYWDQTKAKFEMDMDDVRKNKALHLWRLLEVGQIPQLLAEPWKKP